MSGPARERVIRALRALIRHQHATNARVTLRQIRTGDAPPYRLDPRVPVYLHDERAAVLDVLRDEVSGADGGPSDVLSTFVSEAEGYINQNNQFISLTADDRSRLQSVSCDYLRDPAAVLVQADGREVEPAIDSVQLRHFRRLRRFVADLADRDTMDSRGLVDSRAVCGEYTPLLQLAVLGLSIERLASPVLGVGCGKSAALVRFLRDGGIDARGIVRLVDVSEALEQADWLSYDYGRSRWGTVVSHLGFANHLLFHHRYASGQPEQYSRSYARILASLKAGGSFVYTPSLPFIERLLPTDRFTVERSRAALSERTTEASPFGEAYRECVGYATRVTRAR